jgi:hypothetical protein
VFVFVTLICLVSAVVPAGEAVAASEWKPTLVGASNGEARSQATPGAPTGVTATCTSVVATTIHVTWTAVTRATTYRIDQSTTSATSGFSTTAAGVIATSWTSPPLPTGTYWYKVTAYIGTNWLTAQSPATPQHTILVLGCT